MTFTSLLVCAEPQAVQVLRRILEGMDMRVEHCQTLAEAAARLAEERFNVLLLDCEDELSACELISSVQENSARGSTLVIAIVDEHNRVRDIFEKGANFVLYKPISPERAGSSLRAARGLMRVERRRKRRIPAAAEASISFAATENIPAPVLNLSENGVAIHSEKKLPPPCKVYFQFTLPGQVSLVRLSGEVMWQDARGRVGLRFDHVPQTSRRLLDEWIRSNLSRYAASTEVIPASAVPHGTEARFETEEVVEVLSLSSAPADGAPERRIENRQVCRIGVEVYRIGDKTPQRCSLTDLSTGGCYVESTFPLNAGTPVEIVVHTENLKSKLCGHVQSSHPGFGMGVKFDLRTAEEREVLRRLLASQNLESQGPLQKN
jgi:CheY-like chemotaxis protein